MKSNLIDNRQMRVFISSTFQDMQDERDYLMKHTFPELRTLAATRDVTLTELDLRWGITEEESKTGKVVEICLREIENSIPFFVGIIGNRYGWVPNEGDLTENTKTRFPEVENYLNRRLSVTDMEMQFGVLGRSEDMNAYFYIKEQEGEQDNPEMLERLKAEVRASKYPSSTYSSLEDLGNQVKASFENLLDRLFPQGDLSELEKIRISQRSFMNQLCQNYIRDDRYFHQLDEWMEDWSRHHLVVTGASGLGKSALIANWLKEKLQDNNRKYNIIYHFTGNGGSQCSHEYISDVLCREIRDVYGWEEEKDGLRLEMEADMSRNADGSKGMGMTKEKQSQLDKLFIKTASETDKPLLIVLDAVNQILDTDNAKLMNWLPYPLRNIKILLSTLEEDRTMEVFSQRKYPMLTLHPLNAAQRMELVETYLGLFSKRLTDAQTRRIVSDPQCENTLVLKTLLDELVNFGVYERLDERIDYYLAPDSIEDFYQALLSSYEQDYAMYGSDFVKHILSLIAVSRNGLSEEEILAITGVKPLYWSQFHCAFHAHLTNKDGLISFSHKYISDTITRRYLTDSAWTLSCRDEIIVLFKDQEMPRAWVELPFQYYHSQKLDELYELLQNLDVFLLLKSKFETELVLYWKKLIYKEYDYCVYRELLQRCDDVNKMRKYHKVSAFFRSYFTLHKFALSIGKDCLKYTIALHGTDHPSTAQSYNDIGNVYKDMGDYPHALEYHQKALTIRNKVLGTEHPATADSYNNTATVFSKMGDYPHALEYHQKALSILEKILGTEHPATASSYNNIGNVDYYMGDYPQALEYYKKALSVKEKVLGTEHPTTASSYYNNGIVYDAMGDYPHAMEYHQKALSIREKVLGKEHPDSAASYDNIGTVYAELGDYPQALEYYKKALSVKEKVLGTEHPATASSYYNIGIVYAKMGEYPQALDYFQKALSIREKVLGTEHPATASSYNNIGKVYYYMGDYPQALEYYKKALSIREKILGTKHPDISGSYNNIGKVYYYMGDYPQALEYYKKALAVKEKVLGTEHPATASSYNNIGKVYYYMGDYPQALEYYKKALSVKEKVLGTEHPATASSYNNTATVFLKMGDYPQALEYYKKALAIRRKTLGVEHLDTADSYSNIGLVYKKLGDYPSALNYYQKALSIREKVLGTEHPATATSYYNIGIVYSRMGDYSHALEYYQKASSIREKVLGRRHLDTAWSYNQIAWTYHLLGKYDEALPWAEKAVASASEKPGIIDTLATVYEGLGKYQEALEQFELCLRLKQEQNASEENIRETEEKISELKKLMES